MTYYSCVASPLLGLIQSTISYQPQPPASIGINEFALHIYQYYTKYFDQDAATAVQQLVTFFTNQFENHRIDFSSCFQRSHVPSAAIFVFLHMCILCHEYVTNHCDFQRVFSQDDINAVSAKLASGSPFYTPVAGKSKWMIYALIAMSRRRCRVLCVQTFFQTAEAIEFKIYFFLRV